MNDIRTFIACFGLLAGAAASMPLQAQDASAESAAADDRAFRIIDEILVTAQKRAQNLQDVSLSISAFEGDSLRALGVREVEDIAAFASNVDIKLSSFGVNPVITMRGVGLNNFNSNNNPSVGVYVDEVFLSSPAMLDLFVMDLERMEVLKGPQGTLYGRNSNGGAINIHSVKPNQELDGFAEISVGNQSSTRFEGAVGGGLTESLSGRVSLLFNRQGESFYENALTGEDFGSDETFGVRGQLGFDAERFSANIGVFHFNENRVAGIPTVVGLRDPNSPVPVVDAFAGPLGNLYLDPCQIDFGPGGKNVGTGQCVTVGGFFDSNPDPFENDIDPMFVDRSRIDSELTGATLKADYDLTDRLALTSITGYMAQQRLSVNGHPSILFFELDEDLSQVSQELRLSGDAEFGTWIIGLNYSKDEFESLAPVQSPRVLAPLTSFLFGGAANPFLTSVDQSTSVYAAFANVDWDLSDLLTLSAGVRYTNEEVEFAGFTRAFFAGIPGLSDNLGLFSQIDFATSDAAVDPMTGVGFDLSNLASKLDEGRVSGRVGLEVRPNDLWLVYGSISTGFKSGGFNGDLAFSNTEIGPFDPETIIAYELGAKGALAGGLVRLNTALFFYDYEGIQTFVPGEGATIFTNAEQADIKGLDLELLASPVDGLDISFAVGWLDTKLSDPSPPDTVAFVSVPGLRLDGSELPNSPQWQVTGLVRYEFAVTEALRLSLQGDFKWTDSKFSEALNDPVNFVEGYAVANARIGLSSAGGAWELSIWARNLFDKLYFTESVGFGTPAAIINMAGQPRTFGLSLNYNLY